MADHFSLQELGVETDGMVRIGALDRNPPPGQPLETVARHIGPAVQPPAPAPQRGWEGIFRPGTPGMGA